MAIKVKLRQKNISKGRKSLYLDFYPAIPHPNKDKLTRREFLGLYIYEKPKNPIDKQHNKNTLSIANSIRQKRENLLNKPEIYSDFEKEQLRIKEVGEECFVKYFEELANKRKASNHDNWVSVLKYLKAFTGDSLKFKNLNEIFLEDFKEFLLRTKSIGRPNFKLSKNTASSYFYKIKTALKYAYKVGKLQENLNDKIEGIAIEETIKNTLTVEELNILAKTESESSLMKRAALFSVLTSLAFMEMKNLTWGQIQTSDTFGVRVSCRRSKTGNPIYLSISDQALELCGERQGVNDQVFEGLNDRDRYYHFQLWLAKAGIARRITFHDLRHTYGVLQIDAGTDIYTLQKQMGHGSAKQTQHYAKMSAKRQQQAANKIILKF